MQPIATFSAPWGTALKLISALSVLLLAGIALIGILSGPKDNIVWIIGMIVTPLLILGITIFFLIRGYVLTSDALMVQRLGWNSTLLLTDLSSAETDPKAMAKSIRTFGNGGLFSISGKFRNKKLGSYRAFVTDPKRAVVLKFSDRTVVVTPDRPDTFVAQLKSLKKI